MADVVDMAVDLQDEHLARSLARARAPIAAGGAGECEQCFEDSPRLVGGRCAYCRDGRRRPANPTSKQPALTPAPPREDIMPAKSVQLPAPAVTAIAAIERHAQQHVVSLGTAAAALIDRGLEAERGGAPAAPAEAEISIDGLLQLIRQRFDALDGSSSEELGAAIARAEAAEERADAAEAKLSKLREALAA